MIIRGKSSSFDICSLHIYLSRKSHLIRKPASGEDVKWRVSLWYTKDENRDLLHDSLSPKTNRPIQKTGARSNCSTSLHIGPTSKAHYVYLLCDFQHTRTTIFPFIVVFPHIHTLLFTDQAAFPHTLTFTFAYRRTFVQTVTIVSPQR